MAIASYTAGTDADGNYTVESVDDQGVHQVLATFPPTEEGQQNANLFISALARSTFGS